MPRSEQGVSSDRYQVIPRTLTFIRRGEAVLLIKGAPTKRLWANRYNGIGGHVERGEDVLSSAEREIKEETGLTVRDLRLAGIVMVDSGEAAGIGIFVYRAAYDGGALIESPEGSLEWVPMQRLNDYPLVEDLPFLIERVFGEKRGKDLFFARYSYNEAEELVIETRD